MDRGQRWRAAARKLIRTGQEHPAVVALSVILAVAAALRIYRLGGQSLWIDEIRASILPANTNVFTYVRETLGPLDPPLSNVLSQLGRVLPVPIEVVARLPAALGGIAEVGATFVLVRSLVRRDREAVVAALFVALGPFAIRYSQEARYYTMFSALHLLSWWAVVEILQQRRRAIPIWVAVTAVNLYMNVFAWPVFFAQVVTLLWTRERRERIGGAVLRGAVLAVACFLPWAIFDAWYWIPAAADGKAVSLRPHNEPVPSLNTGIFVDGAKWLLLGTKSWGLLLSILIGGVLIAPVVAVKRRRRVALLISAYIFCSVLVVIVLSRLVHTYFAYRRVEFLVPALFALIALSLCALVDRARGWSWPPWLGTAGLVVLVAGISLGLVEHDSRYYHSEKTNYRAAAEAAEDSPGTTLVVLGNFYAGKGAEWDPIIRRYFLERGFDRDMVSVHELDPDQASAAGSVLWITGAPAGDGFLTEPLNDLGAMLPIAGDESLGVDLVIPLYAVQSSYNSPDELRHQRDVIAGLSFVLST